MSDNKIVDIFCSMRIDLYRLEYNLRNAKNKEESEQALNDLQVALCRLKAINDKTSYKD